MVYWRESLIFFKACLAAGRVSSLGLTGDTICLVSREFGENVRLEVYWIFHFFVDS